MTKTIIARCEEKGLRLTEQRRVIAAVLEDSHDHPDVEELYARAFKRDPRISLATVYRTVKLFEDFDLLEKHEFGDGRARYETADRDHHDISAGQDDRFPFIVWQRKRQRDGYAAL